MTIAERVQQYMIERRARVCAPTRVGPFTVLLHSTDEAIESNLAIPVAPLSMTPEQSWREALRAAFASRGRVPAIQWIVELVPHLASTLQAMGFSERQRETLMVCTSQTRPRSPAPVAGLTFIAITEASPLDETRENLDINEFGFDPAAAKPATDEQAARFRDTLAAGRAFTARLDGHPASAGMYTTPLAGVTELVGITTLEQYRGRGIAAALTAHMASAAFAQGCDLAFLTTANLAARRAYEHAGFQLAGDVVTYVPSTPGVRQESAGDVPL
ncbi:MAG TPA: GNAT family N-acetyltransferase [Ktedonobacterales bacterium]|nr:GNAT family N-acetyltransferase [Ktedonobacterales bacterium]